VPKIIPGPWKILKSIICRPGSEIRKGQNISKIEITVMDNYLNA
jgi:hypothetical protein